ncbi:Ethanolamine-phosphate cytidylyltransferase, partial [Linnemannia zychae]
MTPTPIIAQPFTIVDTTSATFAAPTILSSDPSNPDPATTPSVTSTETKPRTGQQRKPIRIWVDGCYDVMHHGHFNALRQAKAMGDIVVAGVHSDAELLLHKGPTVMNQDERMAAVAACKWVDEVVPNAPYATSLEWMDKYNCDYCVHGDDPSTLADGTDSYRLVKAQGRYLECQRTKGVSTTDLVNRMLRMTSLQEKGHLPEDGHVWENDTRPYAKQGQQQHEVLSTARKISLFSQGNRDPKKGDRIIYVDGTFDLFHVGHIEFLKRAKARGDYLVVGVYDDATVKAIKGPLHPLMNMHERVLALLACRYVDDVILSAPYKVTEHILDGDYTIHEVVRGGYHHQKATRHNIATTLSASSLASSLHQDIHPPQELDHDPYRLAKERGLFVQLDGPEHEVTTRSIIQRIISHRV